MQSPDGLILPLASQAYAPHGTTRNRISATAQCSLATKFALEGSTECVCWRQLTICQPLCIQMSATAQA